MSYNTFDDDSARRIVDATRNVEEWMASRGLTDSPTEVIYAKIESSLTNGEYSAVQVEYNETTKSWSEVSWGIDWAQDSENTNPIVEIGGKPTVDSDTIVQAFYGGSVDDGVWTFQAPTSVEDIPPHPFKVTPDGLGNYSIGLHRELSDSLIQDLITVYDRDSSKMFSINFDSPDVIPAPGASQYIYYRILRIKGNTPEWNAQALFGDMWPPPGADTDIDAIYVPIAYTGPANSVQQLQYSNISVWQRQYQPTFAAFSHSSGVDILPGQFHDRLGGSTTVAGTTAFIGDSAWVEVISAPGAEPVINGTVQTGVWTGYSDEAGGTVTTRYRLGKWDGSSTWIPTHEGDIYEGTLFQPNIHVNAQGNDAQSLRVMASNTVESVGAEQDLFFNGRITDLSILVGDISAVDDVEILQLGGTSNNINSNMVTAVTKTGGAQITVSNYTLEIDETSGLCQKNLLTVGTPTVIDLIVPATGNIAEGPGIDITEAPAGLFTVTSLLDDDGDGVTVTDGAAGAAHVVSLDYPTIWGHVLAGDNVTLNKVGDNMTINATDTNDDEKVAISENDTTPNYLSPKITDGSALEWSINNAGGNENLQGDIQYQNSIDLDGATNSLELVNDEDTPTDGKFYGKVGGAKGWFTPDTGMSVKNSIEIDAGDAQFVNDVPAPGNFKGYFTDGIGDRTWANAHQVRTTDTDDNPKYLDDAIVVETNSAITTTTIGAGPAGTQLQLSVLSKNSIDIDNADGDKLQLVNDSDSLSGMQYYGTDAGGIRNWLQMSALAGTGIDFTGNTFNVSVGKSVIIDVGGDVTLQGDELNPGAWYLYGCGAGGNNADKDWLTTTQLTVLTDIQLDGSNNLQIKTTQIRALDVQSESSFSTVTGWATTACP